MCHGNCENRFLIKEYQEYFAKLPEEYSHLYLAAGNQLATVLCIEDPLREEAASVVHALKKAGFTKVVMMTGDNLNELVTLKRLSNALIRRIRQNYRQIVVINTALILLGVSGILQPTVSATLHNVSTLGISLKSMQNLLNERE